MHTNTHLLHQPQQLHTPPPLETPEKLPQSSSNLSIFPTSFRDVISVILILLAMPASVNMVVIIGYLLFDNFQAELKFNLTDFFKKLIISTSIYYCLNYLIIYKVLFHYLIVLSNSILSNHLIGSVTLNYYNLINNNSHKIITKILISNHKLNCLIYSLVIIYLNYVLNYLNLYNIKMIRLINSPFIHIYLILNLQVIFLEIFTRKPADPIDRKLEKIDMNQTGKEIPSVNLSKTNLLKKSDIGSISSKNSSKVDVSDSDDPVLSDLDSSKLVTIDLSSTTSLGLNPDIFWKNLNTFIISPFNSKLINLSRKLKQFNDSTICFTSSSQSTNITSTCLTTTIKSPNHTTIENIIILQPFWCLIAGLKSVYFNNNLFSRNSKDEVDNLINLSIIKIYDTKVLIRFLNNNMSNLKVKLNNLNWNFFKIFEQNNQCFLVIYGLTPHFKYEIELEHNRKIINRFVINSTNKNSAINESIAETSSLSTLQTLLITIMNNYNNSQLKLRKLKKDENKKLADLKHNIDNLKSKISKYNNNKPINDNRTLGRLKGLKHSVIQLEQEITDLKANIDDLLQQEHLFQQTFKDKETKLLNEIDQINQEIKSYDSRINDKKQSLKRLQYDNELIVQKHQKLINKQTSRYEEIKQLNNDLKSMKKDIIGKFTKKIKKLHENYDLLPNLIDNIEILENDYNNLVEMSR